MRGKDWYENLSDAQMENEIKRKVREREEFWEDRLREHIAKSMSNNYLTKVEGEFPRDMKLPEKDEDIVD